MCVNGSDLHVPTVCTIGGNTTSYDFFVFVVNWVQKCTVNDQSDKCSLVLYTFETLVLKRENKKGKKINLTMEN